MSRTLGGFPTVQTVELTADLWTEVRLIGFAYKFEVSVDNGGGTVNLSRQEVGAADDPQAREVLAGERYTEDGVTGPRDGLPLYLMSGTEGTKVTITAWK